MNVKAYALAVLSISLLTGFGPKEIDKSEVPEGFWDNPYEIYVDNFQLASPYRSSLKSGDCPDTRVATRPYGTPASNAACAETRVYDSVESCNRVYSTFGDGICPGADEYSRKTQQLDAIMSAGTAAQNALLATGQAISQRAQEKGMALLAKYSISDDFINESGRQFYEVIAETIISENEEGFSVGDAIAMTRHGFYSKCIVPHFGFNGLRSMNATYYRIIKDRLACVMPSYDKEDFTPDYMNSRAKSGASFVYTYSVKPKGGSFEFCMKEPVMGFCDYKKKDVTTPADFEETVAFVESRDMARSFIVVREIRDDEVVLTKLTMGREGDGELFTVSGTGSETRISDLVVRLESVTDGKAVLAVTGTL